MTSLEFNSIKVGSSVAIPSHRRGQFIGTQVIDVDRRFKKVTVLLGTKPYSYRYVRVKQVPDGKMGILVGLM